MHLYFFSHRRMTADDGVFTKHHEVVLLKPDKIRNRLTNIKFQSRFVRLMAALQHGRSQMK